MDVEALIVAPYAAESLPDLSGVDGAVFTGSAVEWCADAPEARPLAEAMEAAFAAGLPVLGSCNGMQLAAHVLGGRLRASPKGREDGLARDIRLTEAGRSHPFMAGRRDGFAVPCVHRDEVARLPEGAVLLATNAHSDVQAFAMETGGVRFWGVQYHPEYTLDYVAERARNWPNLGPAFAADLARADVDVEAAARIGARREDMAPQALLTELRNWLARLDRVPAVPRNDGES